MFIVVMTLIPLRSKSSTSWYRLGCPPPGALVWASSSTSATVGRRLRTASRSISSSTTPRYSTFRRGTCSRSPTSAAVSARPCVSTTPPRDLLEVADQRGGVGPAVRLDHPDDRVHALLLEPLALLEHLVGLAHPGGEPE